MISLNGNTPPVSLTLGKDQQEEFSLEVSPTGYVPVNSDFSCDNPKINILLDPGTLYVESYESVEDGETFTVKFRNQTIINGVIEVIPAVTQVLKKVNDEWVPVSKVQIPVDESEQIWVKFADAAFKPTPNQFHVDPQNDDISLAVTTSEEEEGAFVTIEVLGDAANNAKVMFLNTTLVNVEFEVPTPTITGFRGMSISRSDDFEYISVTGFGDNLAQGGDHDSNGYVAIEGENLEYLNASDFTFENEPEYSIEGIEKVGDFYLLVTVNPDDTDRDINVYYKNQLAFTFTF